MTRSIVQRDTLYVRYVHTLGGYKTLFWNMESQKISEKKLILMLLKHEEHLKK